MCRLCLTFTKKWKGKERRHSACMKSEEGGRKEGRSSFPPGRLRSHAIAIVVCFFSASTFWYDWKRESNGRRHSNTFCGNDWKRQHFLSLELSIVARCQCSTGCLIYETTFTVVYFCVGTKWYIYKTWTKTFSATCQIFGTKIYSVGWNNVPVTSVNNPRRKEILAQQQEGFPQKKCCEEKEKPRQE